MSHEWQKARLFLEKLPLKDFLDSDRKAIFARLAGLYLKEKNIKKAVNLISQIIKEDSQVDSFLLIASIFDGMGLPQPALNILGVCLNIYSQEKRCLSLLVSIKNGVGKR